MYAIALLWIPFSDQFYFINSYMHQTSVRRCRSENRHFHLCLMHIDRRTLIGTFEMEIVKTHKLPLRCFLSNIGFGRFFYCLFLRFNDCHYHPSISSTLAVRTIKINETHVYNRKASGIKIMFSFNFFLF